MYLSSRDPLVLALQQFLFMESGAAYKKIFVG